MESKRDVSILIPYKIENEKVFVYLQKRSKDRKVLPNHFAFFGGKMEEGENSEQTLLREIEEEMCFTPKGYEFLGKYDFIDYSTNAYFIEVDNNFEKEVKIMEGDYGNFFSEEDVIKEAMIIDSDKNIIKDLCKLLH